MNSTCIRCRKAYEGEIEADEDKCPECVKLGQDIAVKVNLIIEKRNRENPNRFDNTRAKIVQDMLTKPDDQIRINARDLGLF